MECISLFGLANIVLEETKERIFFEEEYGEKSRGVFLIRGENVVLLGEVVKESNTPFFCPFLFAFPFFFSSSPLHDLFFSFFSSFPFVFFFC